MWLGVTALGVTASALGAKFAESAAPSSSPVSAPIDLSSAGAVGRALSHAQPCLCQHDACAHRAAASARAPLAPSRTAEPASAPLG